ncbi:HEPN domain-containing protein [Magnetospirillum sp. 64-120]|uniref:HEPN domain-containing protein n=1 Tax=Magnetospirillum sp. 64-120 TaxID=1895778 RepID=UPI0025C66A8D|nr:HEPN domain-containing protein [Magnetospirillum sp. 64-120]
MGTLFGGDIHAGLSGLDLEADSFDLGEGIVLRKTFAHLMSPFMMAFKPAPPGGHHPAPWKAASGGFSFDVNSELLIPALNEQKYGSTVELARCLVFLMRLGVNPAVTLPVFANYPFSVLASIPDSEAQLFPFEVQHRYFPLGIIGGVATVASLSWVRERWQVAHQLINESQEFALAAEALDTGQFQRNTALTLVSLWGALEALFSPSTSELRFRVSSLIAAYLEPPGNIRAKLQKEVAKLYDKRSAAAHGKPRHEAEDLLATFNLLQRVLIAIIDAKKVPSKDDLEDALFGSRSEAPI